MIFVYGYIQRGLRGFALHLTSWDGIVVVIRKRDTVELDDQVK